MSDRNLWRLIKLIGLLQTKRLYRVPDMADHLEVSERTIYRDLKALSEAGVPLYDDGGEYRVHSSFFLRPIKFDLDEIMVLDMATRALAGDGSSPYRAASERARDKIEAALPSDTRDILALAQTALAFDPQPIADLSEHHKTFETLRDAAFKRRRVDVTYYSIGRDQESDRQLDPYGLFFRWRAWYLVAYCHLRDDVRLFRVDRIRHIKLGLHKFIRPESFSLEGYLEDAWRVEVGPPEDMAIWFDSGWKRWVCEVEWHPSQSIECLDDGAIVLRLRTGSVGEIKRWVLGFGPGARVLEPGWLAEELRRETRAMADGYCVP